MQIILIGGKARSGKDTLADYLVCDLEKENKKPCKMQVAQYIKYYAMKYFGWDGKEESKPRTLLNKIGTDIIRDKIDECFHINRLIEDINVLSYFFDTFVVSDIRFPIEIEKIRENFDNVTVIKIIRESDELNEQEKSHKVETSLDNFDSFDYVINNDKDLESLKREAEVILKRIGD